MVRYPPLRYLVSHRHTGAIPHFATCRVVIVRYPHKKTLAQKIFAIRSLQVSRDMKSSKFAKRSEILNRVFLLRFQNLIAAIASLQLGHLKPKGKTDLQLQNVAEKRGVSHIHPSPGKSPLHS